MASNFSGAATAACPVGWVGGNPHGEKSVWRTSFFKFVVSEGGGGPATINVASALHAYKGLQWEWYGSCKDMLEGWGAERRAIKLQALEEQARQALEREACTRQETYGRYYLARQWYWVQKGLQGVAKGLAQWAGQLSLERRWRDRLVLEEHQCRVALGVSLVQTAEAEGRRGLLTSAMEGLGLLHAFVRGKQLILQYATAHSNMMAGAHRKTTRAIWVHAIRRVLHMDARGRAQVASTSHALHNMLLSFTTQRRALILADKLHRRMYGAAARHNLADLLPRQEPPPPLSTAEQAQLLEYAVPMMGAQRVSPLLRPHK